MSTNKKLLKIFLKSVESCLPDKLIEKHVKVCQRQLLVCGKSYEISKPVYLIGFGKAVHKMAEEFERKLGTNLKKAVVSVPVGTLDKFGRSEGSKIEFLEGANNNLPDKMAIEAAKKMKDLVQNLDKDDLLIVLISGGGSALLPLPIPPITLEEKQDLIKNLAKKGADIKELNSIRKSISQLKGGGLAKIAYPCKIISLVLSDIISDPLDLIASGPLTPHQHSSALTERILKKYDLYQKIPISIKDVLEKEKKDGDGDGIRVVDGKYAHVDIYIVGNIEVAVETAKIEAANQNIQGIVVSTRIQGNVVEISELYAEFVQHLDAAMACDENIKKLEKFLKKFNQAFCVRDRFIQDVLNLDFSKKICFIFGGEPTVEVKGAGKGGRNQQLSLALSVRLDASQLKNSKVFFLSCGTDGVDGPTDAAGAFSVGNFEDNCWRIKARQALDDNDSYGFFEEFRRGENLVKIGHTGTNVMDLHLLMIEPKI